MKRPAPAPHRNGDDRVQTPDALARALVEHFLPRGRIVDPSSGNGASLRALPEGADWYEIQDGRDFLKPVGRWDWAVGNPSFSQFRAFLQKAMQVADNLVFTGLAPAWFVRARQEDMRQARFALVELCALPIPPTWPQFGIELTAGWARREGTIISLGLPESPRTASGSNSFPALGPPGRMDPKMCVVSLRPKARARRISARICDERATPPAAKRTSQVVKAIS